MAGSPQRQVPRLRAPEPRLVPDLRRRQLLGALLAGAAGALVGGCAGGEPAPIAPAPPRPEVTVRALTDLVPAAKLGWVVTIASQSLLGIDWLRPSLSRVLRDERLDLLAQTTGLDLRQVRELCLASFGPDDVILYLARHDGDPVSIERLFRRRLTGGEKRSVDEQGLVRSSGNIGRQAHTFVSIGREVVGFQYGGAPESGPARIALLFAAGKLRRTPPFTADPVLAPVWSALGDAPLRALLPGPFEGELAHGARGLLAAATAVGAALTPIASRALGLRVLCAGDFASDPQRATATLAAAWNDLGQSDLGHLLGLGEPRSKPVVRYELGRLGLEVELEPTTLCQGLGAATVDNIREIMR
jgi:hypothetical protein